MKNVFSLLILMLIVSVGTAGAATPYTLKMDSGTPEFQSDVAFEAPLVLDIMQALDVATNSNLVEIYNFSNPFGWVDKEVKDYMSSCKNVGESISNTNSTDIYFLYKSEIFYYKYGSVNWLRYLPPGYYYLPGNYIKPAFSITSSKWPEVLLE